MLISEAFPSKYLKAADLKEQQVRVTMDHVVIEDIGDETKPILHFAGKEKGLCLNKTNSNNIAIIYGDDTDGWTGKEIILYPTLVDFQGRSVPAIRVKAPGLRDQRIAREAKANGNGNGHAGPRQAPAAARHDMDDEIPF